MSSTDTTVTTTVIKLTSIFTPPASCSTKWTYEAEAYNTVSNGLLIQQCLANHLDQDCFPSGFSKGGRAANTQIIFSPGACPAGYTTPVQFVVASETSAICCQSDFSYLTTSATFNSKSTTLGGCVSTFPSGSSTSVIARTNQDDLSDTILATPAPVTMWGQALTVVFQESDLSLFPTPTSATSSTTSSSPKPSSSASTPSSGLSTGAKAGIGVGVALAAIGILGLLAWFFRSRKQKAVPRWAENAEPHQAAPALHHETGPEYKPIHSPGFEVENLNPPAAELPAHHRNSNPSELVG